VLCVAYVVLKALDVKLPDLGSITWGQVVLGIAVLAFLLILIKLIAGPGTGGVNISGTGITKSRKIGIFLGLISSAGIVAGAYLNARDSGDLPGSLGGKQRGDTSPPPPTA